MLRFIVSLFTRKPQPIVILQSNHDSRDWSEVKTACRQERFKARREKSIGIVPAILEHVDEEFRSVLMLLVACMFIAFTTTTDAMGQEIHHAPTAEQCRADIAVWKAETKSPTTINDLPFTTLAIRTEEMGDCGDVLNDLHDHDGWEWTHTLVIIYMRKMVIREGRFIDSQGLGVQFINQDAKGAR